MKPNLNIELKHNWSEDELKEIYHKPINDLIFSAQQHLREFFDPNKIQISTLLSIKTGSCPEDCKYCPQSAHYNTKLKKEPLLEIEQVIESAKKAKEIGASRFCMGAAWRTLRDKDLNKIVQMIKKVKELGLETCMTLGMLNKEQASQLAEAGLDYYNHNLDSSEEFYKTIISTRTYQDRLNTIQNVNDAGMNVCSGGIVGMGEMVQDRLKMIQILSNMEKHPQSVPINLLVRVEGTPLANVEDLDQFELVRTIATTRIAMPSSYVRLSAGRENMSEAMQALCLMAGANSIFYGEKLLTTSNPKSNQDKKLLDKLGFIFEEN